MGRLDILVRNYAMFAAFWEDKNEAQRDLERVKEDFLPGYELEVEAW